MVDRSATGSARSGGGPGRFITFEGGEGTGKSTQIRRLSERLAERGLEVVPTREPGGSPRAERIREALLSGRARDLGPFAEALLFAAARADHVERLIAPALRRGACVLCDRFVDSTRVYQGALAALPDGTLAALEAASVGSTWPDLTLVLDLPAETGLARAASRRADGQADRFEGEGIAYHAGIRDAFLAIARREPDRCRVVEAAGSPAEVEARIWSLVEPWLEQEVRVAHAS